MEVTRLDVPRPSEVPEVRVSSQQDRGRAPRSPQGVSGQAQAPERSLDPQEMDRSIEKLATQANLKVEQTTDEKSGHKVVRIFTRDGERLLRQMPPEAALRILQEVASGGEGLLSSVI